MREILFRGKRKSDGKWLYGDLVAGLFFSRADKSPLTYILDPDIEEDYDCLGDFDDIDCEVIPKTVGQFTGLTDKNGVEIFEGDVVHIDNYDEGWDSVVEFNGGAFAVDVEGRDYDYTAIGWTEYQSIIIGNIHDNPELLEGKPSAAEENKK